MFIACQRLLLACSDTGDELKFISRFWNNYDTIMQILQKFSKMSKDTY